MSMSLPAALTPVLSGREAIIDALYRCVSAFADDAVFDLNGTIMDGIDAINAQCFASISKMDTTHYLTNIRINILDGSKAEVTCTALAQHYHGGEGMKAGAIPLLAGSFYWVDLVRDAGDGLWKVKKWKLKTSWGQGDWGVFKN
ncbi:conserved hypothetical protein [Talaromyces stipitatus ATCC 10500]|uniref:SnoaL-like domain-containing protein n=1 Tax=Talaromyces stipitatus (strain ATCC 10500 / CBS 375.48 / QM 6759 / NRRL 1006) TaxID=441959 RepID=B8MQD6_TALSN|nr:uncharacterized protein TSTA_058270 [Talaromyces stipitatus ATCC 10500]EED13338.1 conserved hypothetical protein [Talaromyces stipitatus ATCC 10500]